MLLKPVGDSAWSDCLRDLNRTLEGGRLYVFGHGCSGRVLFSAAEKAVAENTPRMITQQHEFILLPTEGSRH